MSEPQPPTLKLTMAMMNPIPGKSELFQVDSRDVIVTENLKAMSDLVRNNSGSDASLDQKSVFIGNVNPITDVVTLEQMFIACGSIVRISMPLNRYTKKPKGYAFLEFEDKESVGLALLLNGNELDGHVLRVMPKRINVPGHKRRYPQYNPEEYGYNCHCVANMSRPYVPRGRRPHPGHGHAPY